MVEHSESLSKRLFLAALPDTRQATRFQESIDCRYEEQLFKEQYLDQVPQFVDVQHYDLRGNEPSYQAFHLNCLELN